MYLMLFYLKHECNYIKKELSSADLMSVTLIIFDVRQNMRFENAVVTNTCEPYQYDKSL
jgi:hypothetical protein